MKNHDLTNEQQNDQNTALMSEQEQAHSEEIVRFFEAQEGDAAVREFPKQDSPEQCSPEQDSAAEKSPEPESPAQENEPGERVVVSEEQLDRVLGEQPDFNFKELSEIFAPKPEERKRDIKGVLPFIGKAILAACAAFLVVFCVLLGMLFYYSGPKTVDLDTKLSVDALIDNPLLSVFADAEKDLSALNTQKIGELRVPLVFFGFLKWDMNVSVRDLTPPVLEVCRLRVPCGMTPQASQCVISCTDKTALSYSFETMPDTSAAGEQTVTVVARDAGGNTTSAETRITVLPVKESAPLILEFGIRDDAVRETIRTSYPDLREPELSGFDSGVCGIYYITGMEEGEIPCRRVICIQLTDTTPPIGTAHSYTLSKEAAEKSGSLTPELFVTDIVDASPVTLFFKTAPDMTLAATQEIIVTARDDAGNETDFPCGLQLLSIPSEVTVECGTPMKTFLGTLFADVPAKERPTPDASFDTAALQPGDYTLSLRGRYSTIPIPVHAVDTTPPTVVVRSVTVYANHLPQVTELCKSIQDASEVTVSYESTPDVSIPGSVTAVILARDAYGNQTRAEAEIIVIADTTPPVISGVKSIYAAENSTVSYRKGVSAYDEADGEVAVSVDASQVDITKSGKYLITYSATDAAGNTATQRAYLYVTGANQVTIDLYADQILANIVTANMTERQKASAIYAWCTGHLHYSTATSHLMGNYLQAAYSGFTTYAGNCYIYYAVASSLLTRAGIENLEIQRDDPDKPHYWNLVKIDGSWYHFDTCPKYKDYPIKTFLLTDRQVADYSENQAKGYYSFDHSLYPATP